MKLEDRVRHSLKRRGEAVRGDLETAWAELNKRLGRTSVLPRLRRLGVAAVALAVASAGGTLALQAFFGDEPPATDRPNASSPEIGPHVAVTMPVGDFPRDIAVGDGLVWATLADEDQHFLVGIDQSTNEVVDRIPLGTSLSDLVPYEGGVWGVLHEGRRPTLQRFDDEGRAVVSVDGIGGPLAREEGSLWAVERDPDGESVLVRLDPTTGEVVDRVALGESAWFLTAGDGAVWVLTLEGSVDLLRVEAETGEITARIDVPIPGSVGPPLAAGGSLWVPVARLSGSWIARLDGMTGDPVGDPIPGTVPGLPLGGSLHGIWFFGDRPGGQVLARLDLESLAFDPPLLLDEAAARPSIVHAAKLSPDGATIWIANHRDTITRVDLLSEDSRTGDPNGPTP